MSIILLVIGLLVVAAAEWSAPREYTAHASRQKAFDGKRPMGHRLGLFNRLLGADDKPLPISSNTIVVRVDGDSCSEFGLKNGTRAMAERVDASYAKKLKTGAFVVIDGPGQFQSGLRIRRFKGLVGEEMHFFDDRKGTVNPRPTSQLWAVITHREVAEPAESVQ